MYTYYVHRNGQPLGPFPASVLVRMLRERKLNLDDLGVESGCEDWQPLRDIVDPALLAPRPSNTTASSDRLPSNTAARG